MEIDKKIQSFKNKINKITEKLEIECYSICENLDYKNSSLFSYNIDKIRELKNHVNSFERLKK
jgi:hypothetical protein